MYGMKDIHTVSITQPLFDKPSVGNTCCAELNMSFWPIAKVPRMAKIVPFCRRDETEEWYQLGIFFIDTRRIQGSMMSVVAYDPMLKGEGIWGPDESIVFPMTMRSASELFAGLIDAPLDERCEFNDSYSIPYPDMDYTIREVLGYIAAAHGGNWIITSAGKLLLIPFNSLPAETNYLVTEYGEAITFGGIRILV